MKEDVKEDVKEDIKEDIKEDLKEGFKEETVVLIKSVVECWRRRSCDAGQRKDLMDIYIRIKKREYRHMGHSS